MLEINEYESKYAKQISEIVLQNLYQINIKDYSKEYIDEVASHFTKDEIEKNFPQRIKCFVALKGDEVVGTASIHKFSDNEPDTYVILTVFVKIENHKQGIGRLLIEAVEEYAKDIGGKRLKVPASVFGFGFYKKLGYDFVDGEPQLNEDKEYIMIKNLK